MWIGEGFSVLKCLESCLEVLKRFEMCKKLLKCAVTPNSVNGLFDKS